jgi:hypothetical protein
MSGDLKAGAPTDIVGHKTLESGLHVPLTQKEAQALIANADAAKVRRAEQMPDVQSAIRAMQDAYVRLEELGWRDAIYCPKDGSEFEVIEAGSTGIHSCRYVGEWPKGQFLIYEAGDLWVSRPILFRALISKGDQNG